MPAGAELMQQVRDLPVEERVACLTAALAQAWSEEERAGISLVAANDLVNLGRYTEALSVLEAALAVVPFSVSRYQLLECRVSVELRVGDHVAADATLAEMERCPHTPTELPAFYGLKAAVARLRGQPEALDWYRKAVVGFSAPELARRRMWTAVWAGLFAVRLGIDPGEWLTYIPDGSVYRLLIEAEAALNLGARHTAEHLADLAFQSRDPDPHIKARACVLLARAAAPQNLARALKLIEEAQNYATNRAGIEPAVLNQIQELREAFRKGDFV